MNVLSVDGIEKSFGGLRVLDSISFEVGDEILGLIGPNGAGKTTLFNIVTGFLPPDGGRVVFGGSDLTGQKPNEIARAGLVRTFQDTRLFGDLTVEENLAIGLHQSDTETPLSVLRNRIGSALRRKPPTDGLVDDLEALLELTSLMDDRETPASSLAYGQQRRLGVGVVAATRPSMLMLDEPLAGMNETETAACMEFVTDLHEGNRFTGDGVPVFIIDHDMQAIMNHTDRIVAIGDGTVIASGEPHEIAMNDEVIRTYMGEEYEQFA